MFHKILFATTATPSCDHAAKVAFGLAQKYAASLYLFHVFGIPGEGSGCEVVDVKTGEEKNMYDPEYSAWAYEEVRRLYTDDLEQFPDADIECQVGVPCREILRKARKENVDVIVMGSHTTVSDPETARYRNVVGKTMQLVAKNARCPVLIISRPCKTCLWQSTTLVCATDFSKASYAAFSFACRMARKIKCRLLIFHSVDITPNRFGLFENQDAIEQKILAARQRIDSEYLPELIGVADYGIHVWEGIPKVEILKFAREMKASLLIIAHHNIDKVDAQGVFGSMVEHVVLRSSCPVLSVNKPDIVHSEGL